MLYLSLTRIGQQHRCRSASDELEVWCGHLGLRCSGSATVSSSTGDGHQSISSPGHHAKATQGTLCRDHSYADSKGCTMSIFLLLENGPCNLSLHVPIHVSSCKWYCSEERSALQRLRTMQEYRVDQASRSSGQADVHQLSIGLCTSVNGAAKVRI